MFSDTPKNAAWGGTLTSSGCYQLVTDPSTYTPQPGDIAITEGDGTGHVAIFDGQSWDADIATSSPVPSHNPNGPYANSHATIYQYVGPR